MCYIFFISSCSLEPDKSTPAPKMFKYNNTHFKYKCPLLYLNSRDFMVYYPWYLFDLQYDLDTTFQKNK